MNKQISDEIIMFFSNYYNRDRIDLLFINESLYKLCYNKIFVTYIDINNTDIVNSKIKKWECRESNVIEYINNLNTNVCVVIDIIDDFNILEKCIESLKSQTISPYIILIVNNAEEKQQAIKYNVDFYWSSEKNDVFRMSNCINAIRGNLIYIDYIMIATSNCIFTNNWIEDGLRLDCDVMGKSYHYIMKDKKVYNLIIDQSYGLSVVNNNEGVIYHHNGIILSKNILNRINWKIIGNNFKNNLTLSLYENFSSVHAKFGEIVRGDMVMMIGNKIDLGEMMNSKLNNINEILYLPILNRFAFNLNIETKPLYNKIVLAPTINNDEEETIIINTSDILYGDMRRISKTKFIKHRFDNNIKFEEPPPKQEIPKIIIPGSSQKLNGVPDHLIPTQPPNLVHKPTIIPKKFAVVKDISKEHNNEIYHTVSAPIISKDTKINIFQKPGMITKNTNIINNIPVVNNNTEETISPLQEVINRQMKRLKIKDEPQKQKKLVIAPTLPTSMPNIIEPILREKEKEIEKKMVEKIEVQLTEEDIKRRRRFRHETISNDRRVMTLILYTSMQRLKLCLQYLDKSNIETDVRVLVDNKRDVAEMTKLGLAAIYSGDKNKVDSLNYATFAVLSFMQVDYLLIIQDNMYLRRDWIKDCLNLIDEYNYDFVGANSICLYNGKDEFSCDLINDRLDFNNKHLWSYFYGRLYGRNFLDKIRWKLLDKDGDYLLNNGEYLNNVEINAGCLMNGYLAIVDDNDLTDAKEKIYNDINFLKDERKRYYHGEYVQLLGRFVEPQKQNPLIPIIIRKKHKNNKKDVPKISIVIPTYNGYPQIKNILKNIYDQTYERYEIIIVNDGSSSIELNRYLNSLPRKKLKIINLEKNAGLPNALNVGLENSTGQYWTWISDDNTITSNFLERMKTPLDNGYDFVYSDYMLYDKIYVHNEPKYMRNEYSGISDILYKWQGMPSYMWKRELISAIGKFDINIQGCEDYEYVVKTFICAKSIYKVNEAVFNYYKRDNTLSTRLRDVIPKLKENTVTKYMNGNNVRNFHNSLKRDNLIIFTRDVTDRIIDMINVVKKENYGVFVVSDNNDEYCISNEIFDLYVNNFNISMNKNNIVYYDNEIFEDRVKKIKNSFVVYDWNGVSSYCNIAISKERVQGCHLLEKFGDNFHDIIGIDYTIIYPPTIRYDLLMQRPTQFMKAFGKMNRVRSIFVDMRDDFCDKFSYKFILLSSETFMTNIKQYIKGKLIYYNTLPENYRHIQMLQPDYVIFDLIDNPVEEFSEWNSEILIKCIREADLFICSAKVMYDKFCHLNNNTILVSNGSDYSHFEGASNKVSNFRGINKKIIGYYGAHASWVDFDLVRKIADWKSNEYHVVMIGKEKYYNLEFDHPNITWIDHLPYDELPSYLSKFDICMIPFKLTEMIRGCDPIKFYEYLAAGKPIISTNIEPIMKYSDICYFIDHRNYGVVIDSIKDESDDIINRRKMISFENSWDVKAKTIIDNIVGRKINYTIVYPPYVKWDKMYQRPQQMMTALSRKKGVRCIFIDMDESKCINNSLIIVKSIEEAEKWYEGKVIIYYNHPLYVNKLHNYKYDGVIFELVDNPVDEFSDWYYDLPKAINTANSISITASELGKYIEKQNKKYTIIPNGADYLQFKRAENRLKKPNDFPNERRIVIGYYGAHASWVDFDLIKKIANLNYVHVVMIGKMEKDYNISFEHRNITWLPMKSYDELPYYLSWFDICMIPFKLTNMIKGCDPIKFYEYCSAGKPVIATEILELKKHPGLCYFMDHDNFKTIIDNAIRDKDNLEKIKRRQLMAQNNSWDVRTNVFMDMVKEI